MIDVYKIFSPDFGWSPDFDQNKVLELSNNSCVILVFSEVSLNSILPDRNPQWREKTNFRRHSLIMMMMIMMMMIMMMMITMMMMMMMMMIMMMSKFVEHEFL